MPDNTNGMNAAVERLAHTRDAGKRLTWRTLLRQEANARVGRYINARGRKQLRKAIEEACPLLADEVSSYRRAIWRQECLRILDIHRNPPTHFSLSPEFVNEPVVPCITRKHRK